MNTLPRSLLKTGLLLTLILIMAALSSPVRAERTILTVDGAVERPLKLSMSDIEAMPTITVSTETIWTDQRHRFSAVSLQTLLQQVKASPQARTLTMVALNDYAIEVEIDTLIEHNAFVAFAMDGEKMRIRDKGPLWVLYPFSDQPEINIPPFQAHSIWQLKAIIIQ